MGFLEVVGLVTVSSLVAIGVCCMAFLLIEELVDGYKRFRTWMQNRRSKRISNDSG